MVWQFRGRNYRYLIYLVFILLGPVKSILRAIVDLGQCIGLLILSELVIPVSFKKLNVFEKLKQTITLDSVTLHKRMAAKQRDYPCAKKQLHCREPDHKTEKSKHEICQNWQKGGILSLDYLWKRFRRTFYFDQVVCPAVPAPGVPVTTMCYEWSRYGSFDGVDPRLLAGTRHVSAMAKDGFYWDRRSGSIRCFCCRLEYNFHEADCERELENIPFSRPPAPPAVQQPERIDPREMNVTRKVRPSTRRCTRRSTGPDDQIHPDLSAAAAADASLAQPSSAGITSMAQGITSPSIPASQAQDAVHGEPEGSDQQ